MQLRALVMICLLFGSSAAWAESQEWPDADGLADATAARFPQPVRVGDLIDRRVLEPDESRPTLGWVRQVVKQPDGTITVVMDYGGFLGFFSRPIAVPVNAMVLVGQDMEIVEYDPDQLRQFSNFNPKGTTPLSPNSVIRVGLAKPSH